MARFYTYLQIWSGLFLFSLLTIIAAPLQAYSNSGLFDWNTYTDCSAPSEKLTSSFAFLPPTVLENDSLCNDALSGTQFTTSTIIDPLCVGCQIIGESNAVNANLSDYTTLLLLVSPLLEGVELGVANTQEYYPAGNRAGFVVSSSAGILDATVLGALTISTYRNGVFQESATIVNALLDAQVLAGDASKQRIGFVTSYDFDEIRLFADGGLVGAALSLRVYYAFEEPAEGCGASCVEALTSSSIYNASISGANSGLDGLCIGCSLSGTGNLIDGDTTNFANISIPIGVLSSGSISVSSSSVFPAGHEAGFIVRDADGLLGLLDATVLGQIRIRTYLGGVLQESNLASATIVTASLLEGTTDLNRISFKTSGSFDEISITVSGLALLGLNLDVFYAFIVPDSDNDGIADCADQCPLGDDLIDSDSDGIPDACDEVTCTPISIELEEDNGICNDAINGLGTYAESTITSLCILCSVLDKDNTVDGDLGNYADLNLGVSALLEGVGLRVTDSLHYYPAGNEVGFVLGASTGLIDASILGAITIATYRDGVFLESATTVNGLLESTAVYGGPLARFRIGFETTQDFDAVSIFIDGGLLSASVNLQVYYAYEQPTSCPGECIQSLTDASDGAEIIGARTGFSGFCVFCGISNTSNVIDTDTTNYGEIEIGLGVLVTGSISLEVDNSYPAGTVTGFVIEDDSGLLGLLDAQVLGQITINTYLGGALQESVPASGGLLGISLLPGSSSLNVLAFTTTAAFDEVQISVAGLLNLALDLNIYHAFVVLDSDGDGVGDCLDQCENGNDLLDSDGDGIPDFCDDVNACECDIAGDCLLAVDNYATMEELDSIIVAVLPNDIINTPVDTSTLAVIADPEFGEYNILPDGTIQYWPDSAFIGVDSFQYIICTDEVNPVCDSAWVFITVEALYVRLNLQVYLQGSMLGSPDTLMLDDLRAAGLVPIVEPYSDLAEFVPVQSGGEIIKNPLELLADHGEESVVDWVFVELRDATDSTMVVATRAGLVLRNGQVIDVYDGEPGLLWFGSTTPDSYFVSVRHRNHLGVMTAQAILMDSLGTNIDFTDPNLDLWEDFPNYDGFEQAVIGSRMALWAGNTNSNDGVVYAGQSNDKDPIYNEVIFAPGNLLMLETYQYFGYHLGDVALDSKSILAGQGNDVDHIFNNVDGFGPNFLRLQTFIMRQQLPE
ncbi:MAG: hypothetical protein KDC34_13195 [Saprospiraceae bacterium]|nr:hypothetical protein [Saprospiraceae bacterium]